MPRKASLLVIALVMFHGLVQGQAFQAFRDQSSWSQVSTAHFDVLFQDGNKEGAVWVGRYAERAFFEVQTLFDFQSESHFTLIYAGSSLEIAATNTLIDQTNFTSGVFNLTTRSRLVIHPGSSKELYAKVKTAVASLLLEEFTYGTRLSSSLQSQLLLHVPKWYSEGLAEFVGEGWTPEDESWISTGINENYLDLTMEGEGKLNKTLRKSIWYFITREYGQHKIPEIIYLANVNHSVETGMLSVLGLTLPTFSTRWKLFLLNRIQINQQDRRDLSKVKEANWADIPGNDRITGVALTADAGTVALSLLKGDAQVVALYDFKTHEFKEIGFEPGSNLPVNAYLPYHTAMAFSPNGMHLAVAEYKRGLWQIGLYDASDNETDAISLSRSIRQIQGIAWSHDNHRLVFSGLQNGFYQLFSLDTETRAFEQLTKGNSDHLDPLWSLDDQFLLFASNLSDVNKGEDWEAFRRTFDLYKYPIKSQQDTLIKLTYTPTVNERYPSSNNSFEVAFLSDEAGILNMARVNIFLGDVHFSTNFTQGPVWGQMTDDVFSGIVPSGEKLTLFTVPSSFITTTEVPKASPLRQEILVAYQEEVQKDQYYRLLEKRQQQATPAVPAAPTKPATVPTQVDTLKTTSPVVRFYLFDDEEKPYSPPATTTDKPASDPYVVPASVRNDQVKKMQPPKLEEVESTPTGSPTSLWRPSYLGFGYAYDPVAGAGVNFMTGMEDVLHRHRISAEVTPYWNFRNSDYRIRYTYLKSRVDLFGDLSFSTRSYRENFSARTNDSLLFRFQTFKAEGGAIYPINPFLAITGQLGYNRLNRYDQKLRRPDVLEQYYNIGHAGIGFVYDKVKRSENFPYQGVQLKTNLDTYYDINGKGIAFSRLQWAVRGYKELYHHMVFATQFSGGINLPTTYRQYYLGGADNWLFGVRFDGQANTGNNRILIDPDAFSFSYRQLAMPIRGFTPISRDGSRYMLWNSELRIPISRVNRQSLNSNRLYNLELIPFLDAGTAWVSGNPFSQKNPTDTQFLTNGAVSVELQTLKSPFLIGFGSGLRMNVLGYSLRMDMAWGIEDNTLQSPMFLMSASQNF